MYLGRKDLIRKTEIREGKTEGKRNDHIADYNDRVGSRPQRSVSAFGKFD